jgi:hypothetical protein
VYSETNFDIVGLILSMLFLHIREDNEAVLLALREVFLALADKHQVRTHSRLTLQIKFKAKGAEDIRPCFFFQCWGSNPELPTARRVLYH